MATYFSFMKSAHQIVLVFLLALLLFGCSKDSQDSYVHYGEVKIGNRIWMTANLNEGVPLVKNEGKPNRIEIINARTTEEWLRANSNGTPAWCYYNNDSILGGLYGRIFNIYAFQYFNLAPKGWHVATSDDWSDLRKALGKVNVGAKIKSRSLWFENGNGDSTSGFNGLPGGVRCWDGTFLDAGKMGAWFYLEYFSMPAPRQAIIRYDNNDLKFEEIGYSGYYARCVKDLY